MKRKCKYCGNEFTFDIKDLLHIGKSGLYGGIYGVSCPFCLTLKEIRYQHQPRHLKGVISK